MDFRTSEFVEIDSNLGYPECPVPLSDGGFLLVDVMNGDLLRYGLNSDGTYTMIKKFDLGDPSCSGPNGAAIGKDGWVYIANDGGKNFLPLKQERDGKSWTVNITQDAAKNYAGGYIQRVHLDTGQVELWCGPDSVAAAAATCWGRSFPQQRLSSPDDLIFDAEGGLWFTDFGNSKDRTREITGVYYLAPESRNPVEVLPLRSAPNGIGLSPDGHRLYVAETYARQVVYWELDGPGKVKCNPATLDGSYLLGASFHGNAILDSMRLDEEGNVYVATMLPNGLDPLSNGGFTVISPKGKILEFIELNCGVPEPVPSNLCFAGSDRRSAIIACSGTGRVVSCRMRIPGLAAAFHI